MLPPSIIILTINLSSAERRRASISAQMEQLGLQTQFVEAVAGKDLTAEQKACYRASRTRRYYNYELTPNEQACVLSHRKALGEFLQSGAEYAVVLEDDAELQPAFIAGIRELTERLQGWDMAKLQVGSGIRTYPLLPESGACLRPVFTRKFGSVAVGFLYTRRAACILYEQMQQFWLPADTMIYQIALEQGLRIIGTLPELVRVAPMPSTIDTAGAAARGVTKGKRSLCQYLRHRALLWGNALRKMRMLALVRRSLRRLPPA